MCLKCVERYSELLQSRFCGGRTAFGVAVVDAGVDLLDDLDGAAALVAALDAVVTPLTSTLDLAGGLALTPTFAFLPSCVHARGLGTADGSLPWYDPAVVRGFCRRGEGVDEGWGPVFRAIAAAISLLL